MIEIINLQDTRQRREFVFNPPCGDIFQMQEMAEVYKIQKIGN